MNSRIGSSFRRSHFPTVKGGGPPALTPMRIALFAMHVFVVLFFVGLAGSAVVVAISFVEDLMILVAPGKDGERD